MNLNWMNAWSTSCGNISEQEIPHIQIVIYLISRIHYTYGDNKALWGQTFYQCRVDNEVDGIVLKA